MSSILRKLEDAVNPEGREYRAAAAANAPPGTVVLNPNDPRAAAAAPGTVHAANANAASPAYGSGAAGYPANPATAGAGAHQDPLYPQSAGRHGGQAQLAGVRATRTPQDLPGPAPNTAGPHRHDFLNRLDPRVDSDMSMSGAPPGTYGPAAGTRADARHAHGPHATRLNNATNARGDVGPYAYDQRGAGGGVDGGMSAGAAVPEGTYTHGAPYATQAGRVGEGNLQGGGGGAVPRTAAPGQGYGGQGYEGQAYGGQGHVLPLGPGTVSREEAGRGNFVPSGQGAALEDGRRDVYPSRQPPVASGALGSTGQGQAGMGPNSARSF